MSYPEVDFLIIENLELEEMSMPPYWSFSSKENRVISLDHFNQDQGSDSLHLGKMSQACVLITFLRSRGFLFFSFLPFLSWMLYDYSMFATAIAEPAYKRPALPSNRIGPWVQCGLLHVSVHKDCRPGIVSDERPSSQATLSLYVMEELLWLLLRIHFQIFCQNSEGKGTTRVELSLIRGGITTSCVSREAKGISALPPHQSNGATSGKFPAEWWGGILSHGRVAGRRRGWPEGGSGQGVWQ